jgi:hypothetical protein
MGACRARARRPGHTAASLPTASPAVPPPVAASDAVPGRAGGYLVTAVGLTSRAESALDAAGPGRQAGPSCLSARTGAGTRGGGNTVPPDAARKPCPLACTAPERRAPVGGRLP